MKSNRKKLEKTLEICELAKRISENMMCDFCPLKSKCDDWFYARRKAFCQRNVGTFLFSKEGKKWLKKR